MYVYLVINFMLMSVQIVFIVRILSFFLLFICDFVWVFKGLWLRLDFFLLLLLYYIIYGCMYIYVYVYGGG